MVNENARLATAYRGKRVLVTGHTGFKGAWLSLWLSKLGADVVGFSDGIPTQPNHFERLGLSIENLIGDVADADAVKSAVENVRPDIVFHLAAQSLVRRAYVDPVGTYRTNLLGTLCLFEACRGTGVGAIVSATTDKVYKNREWDWGYREADELGGSDPYSASKSCVELLTKSYRHSFLRDNSMLIASVRAGNVVGGGDWAEDRLIPDMIRAVYSGQPVHIRNSRSTRPWQHVLDPLAGYLLVGARLLAGDLEAADAWNFGPVAKASITVRDILELAKPRLPQLSVEYASESNGPHESGLLELDSSKAVKRLGWWPVWEAEMIERSIDWYRAFYESDTLITEAQIDDYALALDQRG